MSVVGIDKHVHYCRVESIMGMHIVKLVLQYVLTKKMIKKPDILHNLQSKQI